ncbi:MULTISPECIES: Tn3 family transposase [Gammaproteobacteria]|jgi:TnpA family transposase|uniref:Transposase Tn3 family protein n=1 Tax=Marinobacter nauticus (strain ATCC 700491 / DSM 11845 / VT8) TaxID=351348 RepID=A1U7J8_MARN8|nr:MULTISPECIES: Tn3 family transposase [Gammaproteobacteria]ABM20967.1 transposase Tn3 family protein [Marinobacter nauticus VT8]MAP28315.1 Tn3 family transposase [Methylophaga sp.]MAP28321.1 Tn3 family transposase [Methylophaga sp.]MTI64866.1 Tn3 family transposase [Methylophaga sp.]|tara:strand:- start:11625 stop:14645 length:3021 start_codon:yes stop_codon:yes gene_type:complete
MSRTKRLSILTAAEIEDLYGVPSFNESYQRFYFTLNDKERAELTRIRQRKYRCIAIALLGYFKCKPILLNPTFKSMQDDLGFIAKNHFDGLKFRRFSLKSDQKSRIYERIFSMIEYENWKDPEHQPRLVEHLLACAESWVAPRALFDAAIEFLAHQKIAIPAYSTLQKIVSQVVNQHQQRLHEKIGAACSPKLTTVLNTLVSGNDQLTLTQLRGGARNFTGTELQKELAVYHHIQPLMAEVTVVLDSLSLSQKNQQHYAERIQYYGAKIKRQSPENQCLYLLCYLQFRYQEGLERMAEGFIHHVRQVKQRAHQLAQDRVYRDWQKAATNVSKAAEILCLFVDDRIDPNTSFHAVQKQAFQVLNANELSSVCRYLGNQKQSADEAFWQHLDTESTLRTGLLRSLFCCLRIEGTDKTQRLAAVLSQTRQELAAGNMLRDASIDRRLPPKATRPLLLKPDGGIDKARYEWFLYLQIPSRLNGQLVLPEVIRYRALDDDLVKPQTWKNQKQALVEGTKQPKITEDPKQLIPRMADRLTTRLYEVSDYLERVDNRDIILRPKGGKHLWRLPTTGKKHLVNNPFFQQMRAIGVADVLRVVDQDTGFIDDFEHVLGMTSKSRQYEVDLLAILIANATNQGIYGIAQISDRTYDQLSTIQANYLRLETLNAANDRINNATTRLSIFNHYNIQDDNLHASADGQKFEAKRETFRTRYSSKYFGTSKGVSAISLNANHMAINARVIGANEHESHYIFDLLMNNSTEIIPDTLSTDTHGVNHVNFALLDLFGYRFAPRYAQVGRVINEMFDISEDESQRVRLTLRKPINTQSIMECWDTIQRIAVSLAHRKTTQAILVRKLSGYKKNHPLLKALTEYNRLLKAQYLLDYIDNASLRNHVQRALNRGEAYHQLRRAISNVNSDRFRGNSDEEIQIWNESARLVANAIIYFNSKVLSNLLDSFEEQGSEKHMETVKGASPVAWENINFRGTYTFAPTGELPKLDDLMAPIEGYRPISKN